jgi:hypothetical protein
MRTTQPLSFELLFARCLCPLPRCASRASDLSPSLIVHSFSGLCAACSPVTVQGALSGVMGIFSDTVMDVVGKGLEHTMESEVTQVVDQRTPPQVLDLTWPPLKHNITNTVTDAVVQKTVKALAKSLPNALGPYLVETVYDSVVPHAYIQLSKLLTQDISMDLIRQLPTEVNRALTWSLVNKLTRSIGHAVTATLTVSLAHPTFPAERAPVDEIACTQCFHNKQMCELCHSSEQFVYFASYYATYYS